MLIGNRIARAGGRRGGIPADYVEVEYIYSPGGIRLEVPTVQGGTTDFHKLEFMADDNTVRQIPFSTNGGNGYVNLSADGKVGAGMDAVTPYSAGVKYTVEISGQNLYLDGVPCGSGRFEMGDVNANLFHYVNNAYITLYSFKGKIYSYTAKNGTAVVANLVACRRVVDNVAGFYDTVARSFLEQTYANPSTNKLSAGPDKGSWANPYATSSLVAMWDGENSEHTDSAVYDVVGGLEADLISGPKSTSPVFSFEDKYFDLRDACLKLADCTDVAAALNGSEFTVEMVVYGYGDTATEGKRLYFLMNEANPGSNLGSWSNGSMFYYQGYRASTRLDPSYGSGVTANSMYYMSFVNSASGSKFRWSKGAGVKSCSLASLPESSDWNGISILLFGNKYLYDNFNFNGRVYNFRIYSRALTDDEVAANYAVDQERFGVS